MSIQNYVASKRSYSSLCSLYIIDVITTKHINKLLSTGLPPLYPFRVASKYVLISILGLGSYDKEVKRRYGNIQATSRPNVKGTKERYLY